MLTEKRIQTIAVLSEEEPEKVINEMIEEREDEIRELIKEKLMLMNYKMKLREAI